MKMYLIITELEVSNKISQLALKITTIAEIVEYN